MKSFFLLYVYIIACHSPLIIGFNDLISTRKREKKTSRNNYYIEKFVIYAGVCEFAGYSYCCV